MPEFKCFICGKKKKANRKNVRNPKTYHCKDCHGIYMKMLYDEGKVKDHDFSTLVKLNSVAKVTNEK